MPFLRRLRMVLWSVRRGDIWATADDLRELHAHISQADSVDCPPEPGQ